MDGLPAVALLPRQKTSCPGGELLAIGAPRTKFFVMNDVELETDSDLIASADRDALRNLLRGLLPLLGAVNGHGLRAVAQDCLTLLERPGRLRKEDAAPLMRAVHEQCAELFRRGAAEMLGEEREVLSDLADQAAQEAELWREREGPGTGRTWH